MTEVVGGVLASCYCGITAGTWIEHDGSYVCVHERCLLGLPAVLDELAQARETAAAPAGPRGAYARRAARPAPVKLTRLTIRPVGQGSPYHVPGMHEGAPWVVITETNHGHLTVNSGQSEEHARAVNHRHESLTTKDLEISYGGFFATGGAIMTPAGRLVAPWGTPITLGSPRWRPITRVRDWATCPDCKGLLWPGCLRTLDGSLCVSCTAALEGDDPRVWPSEPGYPGDDARPDYLGGVKKRRR